jgi:molybdate transport system substrate-binding protein
MFRAISNFVRKSFRIARLHGATRFIAVALGLILFGADPVFAEPAPRPLLVFGAASVTNAVDEIAGLYSKRFAVEVKASYGASSVLAKQLEAGAPADLFISADQEWMDYAAKKALIKPESRINLVSNSLVLIAAANNGAVLDLRPGVDLKIALAGQKLAIADPDSVPAGRYGKAALIALGAWDNIATQIAPAENVRVALAYVARRETPLGIVYGSDAKTEPKVRVVATFPANTHPPIVYPAALTVNAQQGAGRFLEFLSSPEAQAVFAKAGFGSPK